MTDLLDPLAAPETDAVLAELDGNADDISVRAATVIRLMRAEHRRLWDENLACRGQMLAVEEALAFDHRPKVGEDWPNYHQRIKSHLANATAALRAHAQQLGK